MSKLAYSALTDKIYIIDSKGKKVDVTQNFLQVFLLWFHGISPKIVPGQELQRSLKKPETGENLWFITLENVNDTAPAVNG